MIAVSNGAECATPQASVPGSSLVYYAGKANTTFLSDLIGTVVPPLFPAIGFLTGQPSLVLGVLPGRSEIKADMQLYATADGGGNQVYYNKVTYTKKLLWLIPITTTLTSDVRNAPTGMLSYESYAGGLYVFIH
ncbi:hypothetical protein [Solitalea canadensis]|uniref:hypothetical protein n=1 Tax=Solitalea canadensis TaxID=995 RepID=UPI0002471868|nr:hypothetical protein [Solitalea canadensis]